METKRARGLSERFEAMSTIVILSVSVLSARGAIFLAHGLDAKLAALDLAFAETLDGLQGLGSGHGNVGKVIVNLDFTYVCRGQASTFSGQSAEDVAGSKLLFTTPTDEKAGHGGLAVRGVLGALGQVEDFEPALLTLFDVA